MAGGFKVVGRTDRFERDYKKLDEVQRSAVDQCIRDLAEDPLPAVRRFHCVSTKRPKVYSLDVFSNKSYKITIQLEGQTALLRRVATHKEIDANP